jgi:hypothetical protein
MRELFQLNRRCFVVQQDAPKTFLFQNGFVRSALFVCSEYEPGGVVIPVAYCSRGEVFFLILYHCLFAMHFRLLPVILLFDVFALRDVSDECGETMGVTKESSKPG